MWRKILVSSLVLLYSLSVVGLPLHFHYCQGELKHITLFVKLECHGEDTTEEVHACCGVLKAECSTGHTLKQCCADDTEWLHESVLAVCITKWQDSDQTLSPIVHQETETIQTYKQTLIRCATDPDPPSSTPLYLSNCALIYYG